jgi:hypothetical protein
MGFRLNRTYALSWDAGDMKGAEIKIRATSTSTALALREGTADNVRTMVDLLVQHIISWNFVREDDTPLPLDTDMIMGELEESVLAEILLQWYRAATGVSAPLDNGSTSGAPFPVESIPME